MNPPASPSRPDESPDASAWLLEVLDPDPRLAEQCYIDLRRQLRRFFEWSRCASPEDLVQETLIRAFRQFQRGARIFVADPRKYFFGIAWNLVREDRKDRHKASIGGTLLDGVPSPVSFVRQVEARLLLHELLATLAPRERDLLIGFYTGDRDALCRKYGITRTNLRVRVHRIRKNVAAP
jgi:RNA polymerase sigma factor (sigma-70 family)